VEVFGRKVSPGDLIHADKHGFLVVTPEEQPQLLEAAKFMDTNECETVIQAARSTVGLTYDEILENMAAASRKFAQNAKEKFQRSGEW
jgi:regulator of RNase E activity RraA